MKYPACLKRGSGFGLHYDIVDKCLVMDFRVEANSVLSIVSVSGTVASLNCLHIVSLRRRESVVRSWGRLCP